MKFYNRKSELEELKTNEKISKKHKAMIVITGRRRVGKTELIQKFFSKRNGIYLFVNPKKTSKELLSEFSSILTAELSLPKYVKISTWGDFLKVLFDYSKKKRMLIAIDEFQRFLNIDKSIIFQLQEAWDVSKGKMFLVLSGSSIGMIKKIFIEQKAPLFKRAHNILTLKPFDFKTIHLILEDCGIKSMEEQIRFYSIFGGIPMYYMFIQDYGLKDLESTIDYLLLRDKAPLGNEVSDILIEEFGKEIPTYYAILTAISLGKTTPNEIAGYAGIKETSLAPYIENLSKILGVVKREIPITEKKHWKSKKGRYFLKDDFFRFWFEYIYRNMSYREIGNYEVIKKKINSGIDAFIGISFEGFCKETLLKLNKSGKTPFPFEKIGRQWGKIKGKPKGENAYEIDIVALNEKNKEILFCECKWKRGVNAEKVLAELKEKAQHVQWNNQKRKEKLAPENQKIDSSRTNYSISHAPII